MRKNLKKILLFLASLISSILFILVFHFSIKDIVTVPEANGTLDIIEYTGGEPEKTTLEIGKDFSAIRISDLKDLNKISHINYIPDEFVLPGNLSKNMQIVDLNKSFEFSKKGTLMLFILNLDPWDKDFHEKSEALSKYKIGDYWEFTLALPQIFSASNIYLKSSLVAQNGTIKDYDFIDFTTSYDKKTESFAPKTENVNIKMDFYTRRTAIEDQIRSAQIITIHYEAENTFYSGMKDTPLIGTQDAIQKIQKNNSNLLLSFAFLSVIVFAILLVLSLLKHTKKFISAILWITGIVLILFSYFSFGQSISFPLVWVSLVASSIFLCIIGAILGMDEIIKKRWIKYVLLCFMLIGALLAFISSYVSFDVAFILFILQSSIKGIGALILFTLLIILVFKKEYTQNHCQILCSTLIVVITFASLFLPKGKPMYLNPIFWIYCILTFITFISVFLIIRETEKVNAYLTTNLHLEVERQLKDLKSIVSERDNLLQFVSHDMKKPLTSASVLIDNLLDREKDSEQIKTLKIVKQNTSKVITNLSEIGAYAKFNYLAEPFSIVNLSELSLSLYEFHQPDCNANGIVLKNTINKDYTVYVKKQGLENAMSNIILNAIEHANCKTITLSAKIDKKRVILSVTDDGIGIDPSVTIFQPYASAKEKTGGIGLYICKSIIESMNGELTYISEKGKTTFNISLLKA